MQKYLFRERGRFYCIFVDFKRAFDNIQHDGLWFSPERKGISQNGNFLSISRSMYSQLKSCVTVNNGLTQFLTAILVRDKGV